MNQKDKEKITREISYLSPQGRSEMLFFLIGYCDQREAEFWQGMAAFLHLNIKEEG
jgi:hypothetical protein